jgi:NAD(P)-dependent dehydrogenase (short-subunit alcohol dehydrogenase family)
MQNFQGKVAVVTGAASGIGFGLAQRATAEGMRVVLADIERTALAAAESELRAGGAEVLGVVTDVANPVSVQALLERTRAQFGTVHLLCNNAGVVVGGPTWELTLDDWNWVLGVNLWGVIHGIRTFVPELLAHGEEAHVVNTASMAGLLAGPYTAAYTAAKHAVVGISESLHNELGLIGDRVGVSVLCPGWVNTRIADAGRNRPAHLSGTVDQAARPERAAMEAMGRAALAAGMAPAAVADIVFRAIRERRFWIFTDQDMCALAKVRFDGAFAGRNPARSAPV